MGTNDKQEVERLVAARAAVSSWNVAATALRVAATQAHEVLSEGMALPREQLREIEHLLSRIDFALRVKVQQRTEDMSARGE